MKWFFLFIIFISPNIVFSSEDSLLNCERFDASWWNPFDWFNQARAELKEACIEILNSNLGINSKKLQILELYNPNLHYFDYDFIDSWNENLEIDLTEEVEGVTKYNSTLIKNAFFIFSALNPSVLIEERNNFLIIPYNPNLRVDFDYETVIPENQVSSSFPNFTPKGFCSEEYELINTTGRFDLFIDKEKKIGEDLDKYIELNLTEQGSHTIDGLYEISVSIKGIYHQWREFCAAFGENGCIMFVYDCDTFYNSEVIVDQLILTDFREVVIEQPIMDIASVEIDGINEDLTATVVIEGLNDLQRYNFNNWYVMTNFISKINFLYPPINYLQMEAVRLHEPRYQDLFLERNNNSFIFSTTPANKEIFFEYNSFFFNNTIKLNLTYKNFTYPDIVFDKLWYSHGDNVTIFPYIFREKYKCKNCSILLDNVRIMYGETNKEIRTNEYGLKSSVSFIYDKEVDCVTVYYPGDENHYASQKCIQIPKKPIAFNYLITLYFFIISVAIMVILAKFALKKN